MKPGEPLAAGHMLDGRYRVNRVLGQGGMGRVYLSNDTRLANRPVAVKEMIVGEGLQEKKAIEDFAREARVLAPLSHPGIPNLIDYFVERGRHYLVMEFVAGGDLQHYLDKLGLGARAPEDKVLRWARQLLDVLDFLHNQTPPIVYRDLKPGNVMIDKSGRAMLIDFGIARFLPPGGRGTQIGSVGYAPPEQYLGKMEPRSDLYSLAATMHHLLTGRDPQLEPPFSFPPVRELAPEVSQQTADVVMRALDKDVEKRPASARDMLHLLPDPGPETASTGDGAAAGSDSREPGATGARASSHAPLSQMRTVVLEKSARKLVTPKPAPGQGALFANISHIPTRPGLGAGTPAAAKISPTAKTRDLGRLRKAQKPGPQPAAAKPVRKAHPASAAAPSRPSAGGPARAAAAPAPNGRPAPSRPAAAGVAGAGARLVAKSEAAQFVLSALVAPGAAVAAPGATSQSVIIGRAINPADAVDIDLSVLKRGADRVSRRHAEIIRQGSDYFIRDLGSLNGTYILGRGRLGRDQLYKLKDRDQVVFGGATFEFRKG